MEILNFVDVDWGADEAKGDRNLVKYFLKIPEYDGILDGKYRYVIGRKGTGKTAIIERIREEVESNALWQGASLSLRDFPLSLIRKLRDKSYQDKSQFVPVWKFLMLVEICKFIATDQSAEPHQEVSELREFIKLNFPQEFTFVDTLTYLDKQDAKVSITSKLLGLSTSEEQSVQTIEHVHFQKASQIIQSKLHKISSRCQYFLFFDELDEGYRAGDKNLRLLLLSLLRSVEDVFLDFDGTGLKVRPVLALRSDIFDSLEDNGLE